MEAIKKYNLTKKWDNSDSLYFGSINTNLLVKKYF